MNFKTIPATREVIESPIEARVSVDQHYIICSHVLSYIIYPIRTLLHMFPVHKMKGLQHLRYPVLQAPLYLPFLVVNKHDIASTLSLWKRIGAEQADGESTIYCGVDTGLRGRLSLVLGRSSRDSDVISCTPKWCP